MKNPFYFIKPGNCPHGGGLYASWIYKIPQGFSCGVGVEGPDFFDEYVTVDCSEIVVKVAKARNCNDNPDFGADCFNYVNWF